MRRGRTIRGGRVRWIAFAAAVCAGTATLGFLPSMPSGLAGYRGSALEGRSLAKVATASTTAATKSTPPAFGRNTLSASLAEPRKPNRPGARLVGNDGRGGRNNLPSDDSPVSHQQPSIGRFDRERYGNRKPSASSATGAATPAGVRNAMVDASGTFSAGTGGGVDRGQQLRERLREAPGKLQERVVDLRDDVHDRMLDIRESLAAMTSSISADYLSPLTHLVRTPSTLQYSAAMSVRLSYFMAQQSLVSSTVGGKLSVDPVALSRAVLAALADGREEPILEALRVPEERITSTENYAWWSRNLKGIVTLMKREAVSIEKGEYLLPYDMRLTEAMGLLRYNPAKMIVAFVAYYRQELHRKKTATLSFEETPQSSFLAPGRYPDYFLTDEDFLSAKSSWLMDYDMESKVWGMGDAMRRRSIARIGRALADKDPETASLLEVGCGTGRFLSFVKSNFELLKVTALDLSLFNLQLAKEQLGRLEGVTFLESNAEHMAIENESQDVVTCNFLLSVIPPEAQANVINEIARTLKPGGKAIIVDAAQPEFDGAGVCTLDGLPSWGKTTPIYRAYLKTDLEYALIKAGLFVQDKEINWVSKVLVASKPPRLGQPSALGRMMGVGS